MEPAVNGLRRSVSPQQPPLPRRSRIDGSRVGRAQELLDSTGLHALIERYSPHLRATPSQSFRWTVSTAERPLRWRSLPDH